MFHYKVSFIYCFISELPLDFKKPLKDFRCTENETVTSEAELNKPDVPVTWLMNGQPISADTEFTVSPRQNVDYSGTPPNDHPNI